MKLTILIAMIIALDLLAGCATAPPIGSVAGGECKIVHVPTYAVKGKTTYDQEWIDDTSEAIIRGCRQPRPKARPASFDAPAVKASAPVKKKHWW